MKLEQKEAAQRIYFQTDIPISQIAEILNVSERTLYYWIEENGWAEIKKCAQHMPIKLIDNCYHILANLQDHLLSDERKDKPVTHLEVNSMHKLVNTITKLRTRNTLSENIELNTYFLEFVEQQNPDMAEQIKPYIDGFLATRVKASKNNKIQFQSPQQTPISETPKPQPITEKEPARLSLEELENYKKQYPEKYQKALEQTKAKYLSEHPDAHPSEFDELFNNIMPQLKPQFQQTPPLNRAQRRKLERSRKAA